jgi:hypothetical protein
MHYRRIQFYVEDNVNQGLMWIDKVNTKDNIADIGTKQVTPISQFEKLRDIAQGVTPTLVISDKIMEILEGVYDKVSYIENDGAIAPVIPQSPSE